MPGISASDSDALAEHNVETIEQLAETTVDDLCDWLDISVDEAEDLLDMARAITDARRAHASMTAGEALQSEDEYEFAEEETGSDESAPIDEADTENASAESAETPDQDEKQ